MENLEQKLELSKIDNVLSTKVKELSLIDDDKSQQIKNTFLPMIKTLSEIETEYNDFIKSLPEELTKEHTKKARELRLKIKKIRVEVEKKRKEQKAMYVLVGKAIDGVSNIFKWAISDKEKKLEEVEKYFEIIEKQRLEQIKTNRISQLSKYVENVEEYDVMKYNDIQFKAFLKKKKDEYLEMIELKKREEEERKRKEEQERIEKERLEKELALEREKSKKIQEQKEKELALERERLKKIQEQKEKELEEERKNLQKEKEELEKKLINNDNTNKNIKTVVSDDMPDIEIWANVISDLQEITKKYSFKSKINQKLFSNVIILINKVINYINEKRK